MSNTTKGATQLNDEAVHVRAWGWFAGSASEQSQAFSVLEKHKCYN